MQWSEEANGGFSSASPGKLVYPRVAEGAWGYRRRNVTGERLDPSSFYNWMVRLIANWHDCPELGQGRAEIVGVSEACVFAHRCRLGARYVLAVHNLGDEAVEVVVDVDEPDTHHLLELFADDTYEPWDPGSRRVKLNAFGYRWFRRTKFRKD